ncbi:MAG: Hpt domain-containing protein, partial [Gemmatimonadales bacterium]
MDVSKYAALFLAESREHLGTCNQLLLEWEREPGAVEPVGGLFRAIHTIKGMAATMGYAAVADLAHRTENLLDALRQGRVLPVGGTFELLFRAVDEIGRGVETAASGREVAVDGPLASDLDAAARGETGATPAGRATGRSARPGRRRSDASRSRPVQVTIRPDAIMRGARATLVV